VKLQNHMKSLRRTLFDKIVLSARPPVPVVQMCCAMLGSLGMTDVRVRLSPNSPLYRKDGGEFIRLIVDDVLAPHVLASGQWQPEEIKFLGSYGRKQDCILVDVGANLGLVTRQLMHEVASIKAAVCFEPHPQNFHFLGHNLEHLPRCYLRQAALGASDGELLFYEDVHNVGNYSLNADAVRNKEYRTSRVECVRASDVELMEPLPEAVRMLPILWKSDTQGCDELIATQLSDKFWSRVQAGIMEIGRLDRANFDRQRLGEILSQFPVRRFEHKPSHNVTVEEILRFTEGKDGVYRDLRFARG